MTSARVTPPTRATGTSIEAGLMPSDTSKDADISAVAPAKSLLEASPSTSPAPRLVSLATRPGVTIWPWASTRRASAGMATDAPTAWMRPSRIRMVPDGISPAGPMVSMRALVMATVSAPAAPASRLSVEAAAIRM
ncbi:hypothetical protein UAJ10_29565 [Nitrospirillum sp. BR 11164]|uniref:hypothetical protein n=1 Tax=Nitrospirillum sp. BR 11164 TaxID=3104324 RepID=UPI002AFF8E90|nr:hypothetical protein [Nitrospirillum sp. BR 11164]MEA1653153.1 hypothetical protein [Nitrospirillum sp. BR 11164]